MIEYPKMLYFGGTDIADYFIAETEADVAHGAEMGYLPYVRPEKTYIDGVWVARGLAEAAFEMAETVDTLRERAVKLGIKIDRRWGPARLKAAIDDHGK